MGCCKFIVVTFTGIILLSGLGLLGYGIYHIANNKRFEITGTQIIDIAFIAVASILGVLGFIGSVGLCCQNKCLLKLYFALILILLLAEIAIIIYLVADEKGFQTLIAKGWNDMPDQSRIQLQVKFHCCGMDKLVKTHGSSNHTSCFEGGKVKGGLRLDNCYSSIKIVVENNIEMFGGIFGALAFLEFGLLVSLPILIASIDVEEEETRIQLRQTKVRPMPSVDSRYDRMRGGGARHAPPPVQQRQDAGIVMQPYGRTQTHRMNLNHQSNAMYGYQD